MSKKNILFIVPDGVGIRNYLYANLVKYLMKDANLHFWTTLPNEAITEVEKLHQTSIPHTRFSFVKESFLTRIYREAATFSRIQFYAKKLENPSILTNWNKQRKSFKLKLLYFLAEILGKTQGSDYQGILKLEEKSKKHWSRNSIEKIKIDLKEAAPDSIFISHQRVPWLMPICIAAQELGIKVVSCIYSWDNVHKASLAIKADTYVVWSQHMKDELLELYPEILEESIAITGTPQFEFYFQQERKQTRETFASSYHLDASKKWICFSGDDEKTSPYDPLYLEDLAAAIDKMPEADRPQIIFRRCPVDISGRYDDVISKFSEIIKPIAPIWYTGTDGWGAVYPKQDDISLLVNLVEHCDLVVNVGSTMAHDFAVFDKPCLYINYDQDISANWSVDTIYKFQHFRSMGNLEAVGWLNDKNEIGEKVSQGLKEPATLGKDRKKWMETIVNHPLDGNSRLIADQLLAD